MKFINFTIVLFSGFLVLGILSSYFFEISSYATIYGALICFILLIVSWLIARNQLIPTLLFGSLVYLLFFGIGFISYQVRIPKFQPQHYSNKTAPNQPSIFQLKIIDVVKPDRYHDKYIAEVIAHNNTTSKGNVLLSIKKDSVMEQYTIDDVLVLYAAFFEFSKPLNPYQFDYANYLKTLDVYHQFRVSKQEILQITRGRSTLRGIAEKVRNHIINKLRQTPLQTDERSIVQAFVLGQRKDIKKSIYTDYAAAGAIHILAVSGLHVGILFWILSWLLSPIDLLRNGSFLKTFLLLILLWGFALISGFSPSVIRAVTMFSFFSLAQISSRPTNSFNTLFLSFFTLLLVNPMWLFHIGFQLSYAAVFFILWLQPSLFRFYIPKSYILKKLWGIITVSIAAQVGILPLSLYYFHQFPGLFLVTNSIILPFLGLLLSSGILLVLLAIFNGVPEIYAQAYNDSIHLLNTFIHWIAMQDYFLIENIHFSAPMVFGSYLFIFSFILVWKNGTYNRILFCMLSSILCMGILMYTKYELANQELIVFQKNKHTLVGYKNNDALIVLTNDSTTNLEERFPIKHYKTGNNIGEYSTQQLPSLFRFGDKKVLILDSLGVFPRAYPIEIILLTQNSKVNLKRLIDCVDPHWVIADGSNSPYYVNRWMATCKKRKLPFHHTGTKGAFILKE